MYRVKDVSGFAGFLGTSNYPEFEKFGSYGAAGPRRLAAGWKPPLLRLVNPELPLPDWRFVLPRLTVVSGRALDAWGDLLTGCAEALPVEVKGSEGDFFALNIFPINALDLSESRFETWRSDPDQLKCVTRVVFCSDVTANLFALRYFPGNYCSEEFRRRSIATGLRGLECTEALEES